MEILSVIVHRTSEQWSSIAVLENCCDTYNNIVLYGKYPDAGCVGFG
jgi:hypothetical protein